MKKDVFVFLFVILLINCIAGQEYVPGEVIVKYKEGVVGFGNKVIVDNKLKVYDDVEEPISEKKIFEDLELYNLKFDDSLDVLDIVEDYEDMDYVEYAEPNFILTNNIVPDDSDYSSLYWPASINVEEAWNLSVGTKNIVIAILDTGVDWNHPDLEYNIWNGSDGCDSSIDNNSNGYNGDCRGYDFTDINVTKYVNEGYTLVEGEDYDVRDNDPMDFDGHGTHVAGIAAGVGNNGLGILGSCYNCSIMPIRSGFNIINPSGGSVGSLEIDDVAAAIYYAVDNNATIISMSFGGGNSNTMKAAIDYAYGNGSILVASSGNAGTASQQYPCAYEEVICVGAIDSDNGAASYSNYGNWVDLAAPGTGILSTSYDDVYVSLSGTSMSTPMVAGMIGLIKSLFDKNQSEILNALKSTGTAVDFSGTSINRTDIHAAMLSLEDINPIVNLNSPADGHNNLTLNHTFICNGSDWQLSNIKLEIWDSNKSLFYNMSKSLSGEFNESSFETTLGRDIYDWNCLVEDVNGNRAYADSNFSISTLNGYVTLNNPVNNTYTNSNLGIFNCSVNANFGEELNNLTFKISNSSEIKYSQTVNLSGIVNSSVFNYNFSNEGVYNWTCEANDNISVASNIINYDINLPVVNLFNPINDNSYESNNLELSFTFNVSEISSCSLIINDEIQETKNNVLNDSFTDNFVPGDYSWKINCIDLAGNINNSETRGFSINAVEESGSGGSGGGGGGSGGGGSSSSTITPSIISEPVEQIVEEQNIEENFQTDDSRPSGITGLAVDEESFDLSKLQKYKNRVDIFVVLLLGITAILFYRDYRHEKEIAEEIKNLEKE
ncbi:MAG TPA: S8 family serine peptidase [Candidatus Pacearchaeota archaeon]|nr:S8 family serine peptidase [Candidatus Pacearchaeota archaeon]